jgi:molecular chaperone DnaJ
LLSGGLIDVPTLDGSCGLDVQPYPGHGMDYRLPARGFPKKHGRGAGDLILHLRPVYPSKVSAKDRVLLTRLEAALDADLEQRAPELAAWAERLREQQNR